MSHLMIRSGLQGLAAIALSVVLISSAVAGTVRGVKPPVGTPLPPPPPPVVVIAPANPTPIPPVIVDPALACGFGGSTSASRC